MLLSTNYGPGVVPWNIVSLLAKDKENSEYLGVFGEILSSRKVEGKEFNINVLTSGHLCEKTQCVHICSFGG